MCLIGIIQWLLFCEFYFVSTTANPVVGNVVRHAMDNEFPSVVSIGHTYWGPDYKLASMQFCTGTLITTRHVLTAAHCLDNVRKGDIQVFGGSSDIIKCERYEVQDWITYNDWAIQNNHIPEYKKNDIAIVTLYKEVDGDKMRPARISPEKNEKHEGLTAIIAGWGRFSNDSAPRIMNMASVEILELEECESRCSNIEGCPVMLHQKFMCSAGKRKQRWYNKLLPSEENWATTSPGDSGGPLLYNKNILLAVNLGTWPIGGNSQEIMSLHLGLNYYVHFFNHLVNQGEKGPRRLLVDLLCSSRTGYLHPWSGEYEGNSGLATAADIGQIRVDSVSPAVLSLQKRQADASLVVRLGVS